MWDKSDKCVKDYQSDIKQQQQQQQQQQQNKKNKKKTDKLISI